MPPDVPREIEGEVTRIEAVRYLQRALGHAFGSLLFLLVAGVFWYGGRAALAWSAVVAASLVSANGLSIWAWDRLREYFTPAAGDDEGPVADARRRAAARGIPSRAEGGGSQRGRVRGPVAPGVRGLDVFGPRAVGVAMVVGLAVGNLAALGRALRADFEAASGLSLTNLRPPTLRRGA